MCVWAIFVARDLAAENNHRHEMHILLGLSGEEGNIILA